jgi:thioredoxin-dependent peroxiredoxin
MEVLMRKTVLSILAAVVMLSVALVRVQAADQTIPSVGQTAPGFTLPSQDGSQISLSSFKGKWVVLYFYPKDQTPGCTVEAHNFQQALPQLEAKNAVVLGVSVDTPDSHKQFCTKEGLTFRLLADPAHTVVNEYGSLGSFGAMTIANRNTFLIDPQGKIAQEWTKVNPQTAASDVLAAIPGGASPAAPSGLKPEALGVKPPQ